MYGSIFQFRPRAGTEKELDQLFSTTDTTEGARLRSAGLKASYVFKLDQGGWMGVAVFESKEKYMANANDPAQDRWFQRFRALLEADPEWHDGEIVASAT